MRTLYFTPLVIGSVDFARRVKSREGVGGKSDDGEGMSRVDLATEESGDVEEGTGVREG
jgi:hypothetical protein